MMSYTVHQGDTLSSLANTHHTTVSAIAQANHITNPNLILVGSNLTIPGSNAESINLNGYKIKLGTNNADTIDRSNGTYDDGGISKNNNVEKWIIDALDGNDSVIGGTKSDNIDAGGGNDVVYGNDGSDYITGYSGNDKIYGDGGADIIKGGTGGDELTGGAGADTFLFDSNSGSDVIFDFAEGSGADIIDLSAVSGITSFTDLKTNHMQVLGGMCSITWSGGSILILGIESASDFAANDFIFG